MTPKARIVMQPQRHDAIAPEGKALRWQNADEERVKAIALESAHGITLVRLTPHDPSKSECPTILAPGILSDYLCGTARYSKSAVAIFKLRVTLPSRVMGWSKLGLPVSDRRGRSSPGCVTVRSESLPHPYRVTGPVSTGRTVARERLHVAPRTRTTE